MCVVIAVVVAGCVADDPDAPTARAHAACVDAVDLYYAAGCTYSVGVSVPVPHDAMARTCEAVSESTNCYGLTDDLLTCSRRANAPRCGCEEQLAAVMWCR